jgi:hypothetical protein
MRNYRHFIVRSSHHLPLSMSGVDVAKLEAEHVGLRVLLSKMTPDDAMRFRQELGRTPPTQLLERITEEIAKLPMPQRLHLFVLVKEHQDRQQQQQQQHVQSQVPLPQYQQQQYQHQQQRVQQTPAAAGGGFFAQLFNTPSRQAGTSYPAQTQQPQQNANQPHSPPVQQQRSATAAPPCYQTPSASTAPEAAPQPGAFLNLLGGALSALSGVVSAVQHSSSPLPSFPDAILTDEQKLSFCENGYIHLTDVVPFELRKRALAAINKRLGSSSGMDAQQLDAFKLAKGGFGFWPDLSATPAIADLFNRSPAATYAQQLLGPVYPTHGGQIALRFPGDMCVEKSKMGDMAALLGLQQRFGGRDAAFDMDADPGMVPQPQPQYSLVIDERLP